MTEQAYIIELAEEVRFFVVLGPVVLVLEGISAPMHQFVFSRMYVRT